MSTYTASKYVRARKSHKCGDCGGEISSGLLYLAYKPGLRSVFRVCLSCSTKPNRSETGLAYWCRDVELRIESDKRNAVQLSVGRSVHNQGAKP